MTLKNYQKLKLFYICFLARERMVEYTFKSLEYSLKKEDNIGYILENKNVFEINSFMYHFILLLH